MAAEQFLACRAWICTVDLACCTMRRTLAAAATTLRRSKRVEETIAKDCYGACHQAEHAYVQTYRQARWQYRSPRSFSAEAAELDDGRKALERARLSSLWHQRITLLGAGRAVKHDARMCHPPQHIQNMEEKAVEDADFVGFDII